MVRAPRRAPGVKSAGKAKPARKTPARGGAIRDVEDAPEADRLEEFPHPRHTRQLFGHDDIRARLADGFNTGRLHHAWLIGGTHGIGKATLAYQFARFVLAEEAERGTDGEGGGSADGSNPLAVPQDARAARQVAALSHPGLLILRRVYDPKTKRFSASIPVDEIRKLRAFMNHKADVGKWRVVIVDSADELNISAANALLKSLEEPPPRAIFVLISSQPGRLLPTIRSRCRRLDLAPLASDPLRRATLQALQAADKGHEDADLGTLEPLATGSVRQLLMLRAGGGLQLHDQCRKFLSALPQMDWAQVHRLADEIGSLAAAARYEAFFELLFGLIARAVRAGATGAGRPEDLQLAQKLMGGGAASGRGGAAGGGEGAGRLAADPARLASWAGLWETMAREKAVVMSLNLDRKALILETMAQIETLARRHASTRHEM